MVTPTTLTVQQRQASTYNHPCGDLLDIGGGGRREYLDIVVPLYRASIEGDWEAAKVIFQGQEYLVRYSITERKETPLHVAAAAGHSTKFVRYLVNMMTKVDLELQNEDGNTAFCLAAISGNVGMVKVLIEKNPVLPIICGSENMTPLYLAAFHGNHEMVTFLYYESNRMRGNGWTNDDMDEVFLKCIQADIFDVALLILEEKEELPQDKHLWDVLHALARKPKAFDIVVSWPIISRITSFLVTGPAKERNAILLLRLLWKRIMEKPKHVIDEILRGPMTIHEYKAETYPSQILFIAAKMNNVKFLVELIREYPDLMWKRSDDGQSIFHIAVAHRHKDVYNILYEIGSMKDRITSFTDQHGNNILHLVGKNPKKNAYEDWVTTAFQMHNELLWYKEVEGILPPPCREVKNAAGQTPQELFVENHKDLALRGGNWINETLNQSMVVSTLVFSIGFSVVSGGFDQSKGFPIFLRNKYFVAFIVVDSLSVVFSATSILISLSIVLSRRREVLLRRWMAGQLLLLSSILTILFVFALSFLVLYSSIYKRMLPYFACEDATIFILLIAAMYYPLYKDAINVTLDRNLFRPKKRMLFRKSPTN